MGLQGNSANKDVELTGSSPADGYTAGDGSDVLIIPTGHNDTNQDLWRNNTEGTLLASAARTSTSTSPDITNYNGRGITLFLNVAANPGGAETLTIYLRFKDPTSGQYLTVISSGALPAAQNGLYILQLYPGDVDTQASQAAFFVEGVASVRTMQAQVVHSSTGSWTYSLGHCLTV